MILFLRKPPLLKLLGTALLFASLYGGSLAVSPPKHAYACAPQITASKQSWSSSMIQVSGTCFTSYGEVDIIVYIDGSGYAHMTKTHANQYGKFSTSVGPYCAYWQEKTSAFDAVSSKLSNIVTLNSLC